MCVFISHPFFIPSFLSFPLLSFPPIFFFPFFHSFFPPSYLSSFLPNLLSLILFSFPPTYFPFFLLTMFLSFYSSFLPSFLPVLPSYLPYFILFIYFDLFSFFAFLETPGSTWYRGSISAWAICCMSSLCSLPPFLSLMNVHSDTKGGKKEEKKVGSRTYIYCTLFTSIL